MVLMPTDRVCNMCESKHTHGFDRFPFGPVMLCFITFYCIFFSVIVTSVYLHCCVQMSKSQWMRSCGQNKFDFTLQFAIVLMILKQIRLFLSFVCLHLLCWSSQYLPSYSNRLIALNQNGKKHMLTCS